MTGTAEPTESTRIDERTLCLHTMYLSAQLLGICLTLIGLIRVASSIKALDTVADDLLVGAALLFLLCCVLSYWGVRAHDHGVVVKLERVVDSLLLAGLLVMVGVAALITTWSIV